jgi:hypothetical protein
MRDTLNLKALKRSKMKKHNTIYEKAHRIMLERLETPELSEKEVLSIAENFPTLTVNVLIGGDINIRSVKDSWTIRDEGRFYSLYHRGMVFDNSRFKEMFHIQDVFRDLSYIFASVVSHDDFSMGIKKRNAYEVLELIEA